MANKTVAKTGLCATNNKLVLIKENYSHKRLLYGYTALLLEKYDLKRFLNF